MTAPEQMTPTHSDNAEPPNRRADRRRFAASCGVIACVLLGGGYLLTRGSGGIHDVGLIAFGYGIGVAVAAALLALGFDPRRRK